MSKRVVIIVLDSAGVGELPDAAKYGDVGSNTIKHIYEKAGKISLPQMEQMGLGKIIGLKGSADVNATAAYGKAAELSAGKDTTTGHWEIAGIVTETAMPTYPNGFPPEIMDKFEAAIGTKCIGNKVASGTEIINELGEEHVKTGYPIVYTSADSVFQIAAHEDVIPLEKLYEFCKIARGMLTGEHGVGRVIARPFTGEAGNFSRTSNRHDFSLQPPADTMLDKVKAAGLPTAGVGKIWDIFAGKGLTSTVSTVSNMDGVDKTVELMKSQDGGIIFSNLVDFDMKFGHRRDVQGYADALMDFDNRLPEIISAMKEQDLLILTADHGCDPTHTGSDHTREYIPILLYGKNVPAGKDLGTRASFADIAATVTQYLIGEGGFNAKSML